MTTKIQLTKSFAIVASFILATLGASEAQAQESHTVLAGPSYAKSESYSSSLGQFGVAFHTRAQVYGDNYAKQCAAAKASPICAVGTPDSNPTACSTLKARWCGKTGRLFGADAEAGADVTAFSKTYSAVDIGAHASIDRGVTSVSYGVSVLGQKIMGSSNPALLKALASQKITLFKASVSVPVLFTSVTVGAEAVGDVGIDFDLATSAKQATLGARPFAKINAVLSAGVGGGLLGAGVEGQLDVAQISVPASAKLTWNPAYQTMTYVTDLDLAMKALDGNVSVYADTFFYRHRLPVYSWAGVNWTLPIGHTQGKLTF